MFEIKKLTAFIANNCDVRNLYVAKTESERISSTWYVYHVQEGSDVPSETEIEMMKSVCIVKAQINNVLPI